MFLFKHRHNFVISAVQSGWHVPDTSVFAGSGKKDTSWFVVLVNMHIQACNK